VGCSPLLRQDPDGSLALVSRPTPFMVLQFCRDVSDTITALFSGGLDGPSSDHNAIVQNQRLSGSMNLKPLANRRFTMKFLSLIGALAIVIAVGAAVFFFGGFHNVAATQPDLGIIAWALEHIRGASINRHAVDQPPVSMQDPRLRLAPARSRHAVARAVTVAPGVTWAKFSEVYAPTLQISRMWSRTSRPRRSFGLSATAST
jgi:hypothetical protein